uniref:4a-hydroxytetrahydrobiopterin dehydratase n=1 Tax=Chromera velia CCMP2878 TaxID=1169474 RepID=A0A0G4G3B4_9ALVE|mmetsp:Transcript_34674/g.68483  ORF Transcript_34674/g.68483 Transcript_34674/m.68483 type:complete len:176 (+) Transcript_34674:159-686(+)|eukprot:Cvel_20018.t1-p1 / transcript=Cvel_20018.t1 / gene=Cvel_20018 / organism=Chromera_velia_CCMP2878 / gene_product=Putative pterin-4-alpha-carbinolamine dehydratase, putative / transcript_product=Putative pterin-4-alpha-carbinolamine dehydratase, putative / location=Cvel_scaffold1766:28396-32516(+) / protein_length=175 / sequence_SO=supercontig / SO=protein_coding / is_pseudo=false
MLSLLPVWVILTLFSISVEVAELFSIDRSAPRSAFHLFRPSTALPRPRSLSPSPTTAFAAMDQCAKNTCSGTLLTDEQKAEKLKMLAEGWALNESGKLFKRVDFPKRRRDSFQKAKQLVDMVSEVAEEFNHHPDIRFGWGYVEIEYFTHTVNGVTESDFTMAAHIDARMAANAAS